MISPHLHHELFILLDFVSLNTYYRYSKVHRNCYDLARASQMQWLFLSPRPQQQHLAELANPFFLESSFAPGTLYPPQCSQLIAPGALLAS